MDVIKLIEGTNQGFSLYAIKVNDQCLIRDFIESLDEKYQKQIINLFQQITSAGLPKNKERFRPLEDQIYELKTRGGVRILCFFAGSLLRRSLILTHGFFKPHSKILKRETEKAVARRDDYESGETNIVS
jgi:phage-related protein